MRLISQFYQHNCKSLRGSYEVEQKLFGEIISLISISSSPEFLNHMVSGLVRPFRINLFPKFHHR